MKVGQVKVKVKAELVAIKSFILNLEHKLNLLWVIILAVQQGHGIHGVLKSKLTDFWFWKKIWDRKCQK